MAGETINLVLEHLRAMRGDMACMADYTHGLQTETIALRRHPAAVVTLRERDHGGPTSVKARPD